MNFSYQEFYWQREASILQERDEKMFVAVDIVNAHITGHEATDMAGLQKDISRSSICNSSPPWEEHNFQYQYRRQNIFQMRK